MFLYCSGGISVAVLGSSLFDTCTLELIYTTSLFVANISIELSPVTLISFTSKLDKFTEINILAWDEKIKQNFCELRYFLKA